MYVVTEASDCHRNSLCSHPVSYTHTRCQSNNSAKQTPFNLIYHFLPFFTILPLPRFQRHADYMLQVCDAHRARTCSLRICDSLQNESCSKRAVGAAAVSRDTEKTGRRWAHNPSPSKAPGISYQGTMKTSVMMLKTSGGL